MNASTNSLASSLAGSPLHDVLTALGDRVAPISLAADRTLPLSESAAELFPERALVRGRVLSCTGHGATSLALRLVAAAARAGSWVALVDLATIGLDAASEAGVPLERIVSIDTGAADDTDAVEDTGARWADVVAAAADGFELLIVRVPAEVRASTMRKVATRLQQRGAVMLVLGDPGPLVCDGVVEVSHQTWEGLGRGWGHLARRSARVEASGRRLPGRRCITMTIPEHAGAVVVGADSEERSGTEGSVVTSQPSVAVEVEHDSRLSQAS